MFFVKWRDGKTILILLSNNEFPCVTVLQLKRKLEPLTGEPGPYPHLTMIIKQLKVEGFMQSRWEHKHPETLKRLMGWLKEGKLQCREHITKGFEKMPAAFMGLLQGENVGKAVVAV
ncbi:prostaglandin reductase 1-like [Centropristis striata]|uniref:prostaglandin reductase 1-like n=1 Tax=Centropristis striata TaxID=184440 RepID=UPI0027E19B26|nr:prostaglandin reductase 1-like [Centropristis striata]